MTRFLTKLDCKVCGKPMKLVDPDGGFTGGWSEEDERGNKVAEHWSRFWECECGIRAAEGAVDDNPYSDDDGDYLLPDGDPLEWYNGATGDLLDEVPLPPELQADGYWVTTEAGNQAHVLVSPDMSPEGWEALNRIIDAAAKKLDDKPEEGSA